MMDASTCEHDFVYDGVKYEVQDWKLPGSGAQPVHYFDAFHCRHCLKRNYQELSSKTNSYQKILFNATPMPR